MKFSATSVKGIFCSELIFSNGFLLKLLKDSLKYLFRTHHKCIFIFQDAFSTIIESRLHLFSKEAKLMN
jgi:hypothetical protein